MTEVLFFYGNGELFLFFLFLNVVAFNAGQDLNPDQAELCPDHSQPAEPGCLCVFRCTDGQRKNETDHSNKRQGVLLLTLLTTSVRGCLQ